MKIHRKEPLFHKSYGATAVRTMYSPRLMYTVLPDASAQHPPPLMLWDEQGHPKITSPSRTGTVTSPPLHHKRIAWRLANGGPLVQTGSTEPQPGLLTCSHAPVLGGGEHVPLGNDDGCDAQNTDNNQVDEARLRVTVEGVIKPRNKTSHNQKSNTRVIQSRIGKKKIHLLLNIAAHYRLQARVPGRRHWGPCQRCWTRSLSPRALGHGSKQGLCRYLLGEDPGDPFWVAVDCVEQPWERKAENGPQEE